MLQILDLLGILIIQNTNSLMLYMQLRKDKLIFQEQNTFKKAY